MKTSDIGVVAVVYGIVVWFLVMTLNLPDPAQTYPLILITALAAVNTAYLGKRIFEGMRARSFENDLPEIFSGFVWKQFFGVVVGCVIYLAALGFLGYVLSSVLYLLIAQFALKVRPVPAVISCACIMVVIYLVFSQFLKVPLPVGTIFGG